MNLIEDLKWRHACKRMTGAKVPQEKINTILEAINLTPTSLGLQAFKVLVIENEALKDQILAEACPQQPVKECSHLLVFATNTSVTPAMLDKYFAQIDKIRNPGKEWMDHYREKIDGYITASSADPLPWLAGQVYIALGVACVAAANERVDSVPIEGFSKPDLDRILGLTDKGLASVVMLPLGYKDEANDWLNNVPKVRKDLNDLVEVIK